jgi:hypothetical protein
LRGKKSLPSFVSNQLQIRQLNREAQDFRETSSM